MRIDGPVIVALAALAGSLVGAFSSVAATFLSQRLQARWSQLRAELEEREKLYGAFVEEAVHLFVHAIERSTIEPAKIMRLYSKVARIRLTSTAPVLQAAEEVCKGCERSRQWLLPKASAEFRRVAASGRIGTPNMQNGILRMRSHHHGSQNAHRLAEGLK